MLELRLQSIRINQDRLRPGLQSETLIRGSTRLANGPDSDGPLGPLQEGREPVVPGVAATDHRAAGIAQAAGFAGVVEQAPDRAGQAIRFAKRDKQAVLVVA